MANPQNNQGKQSGSEKNEQSNEKFNTTQSSTSGSGSSSAAGSGSGTGSSGTTGSPSGSGSTPGTGFQSGTGSSTTSSLGTTGSAGSPSGGTFGGSQSGSAGQGGSTTGAATATARSIIDQAKETAGQAYEAVTDKAATKLEEQKSTLTGGLTSVADSVRQVSQNLGSSETDSGLAGTAAKYTDTAAQKIEEVATYFENRDVRQMARDLESFARRNPAVFLGAAFGLGLIAARFLKSSSPRFDQTGAGRSFSATAGIDHQLPPATKTSDKGKSPNLAIDPM